MTATRPHSDRSDRTATDFDVVVIGAGFAGIYLLHKLRGLGFRTRVLEMGEGVGGTWYWNRYPGARVDVEGIEYSYSFSKEIEQEWDWSEIMPSQPEIERYLNFVTDRLQLRSDMQFSTRVTGAAYDESAGRWRVETDRGDTFDCQFLIAATGCLSAPLMPAIEGIDSFAGITLFTNQFPRDEFDFHGKRVGVVGTGSSGVQAIPVIAEDAEQLYVFQRSAAYTRPANNRPYTADELRELKADYPDLRRRQRESYAGTLRFGAVTITPVSPDERILEVSSDERLRRVDEMGWAAPWSWADVPVDLEANALGVELYAELVRRHVHDPATAAALVPTYLLGCKRLIIDTDYYATFNKPHVHLVDLRADPLQRVTPRGIATASREYELDVIVYATGFDAMTGALNRIDIRGRGGARLRDQWTDGPRSYLGLQVHGFPNFFTITGPGSPSVHTNMVIAIEQHVDWISDLLVQMRTAGSRTVEADVEAQDAWVEHVAAIVEGTVRASDGCNSWYLGANVPGKRRVYMSYVGGQPAYRAKCDEVAAAGYEGFTLAP